MTVACSRVPAEREARFNILFAAEALLGALHDECLRGGVPQEAARGLQRKPAPPVNALSTGARLFVLSSPATTSQPPLHLPPALSMPVSHARLAASPGEFSAPTLSLSVAGASTHLLGPAVGAALAAARAAAAGVRSPETASAERPAQPTAGRRLARQRSALGRAAGGTPALQPHPQPPHRAAWPAYTPALRPAPAAGAVAAEAGRDTGLPVLDLEGTGGGAGSSARLSIAPPKPAGLVRTLSDTAPAPSGGGASALTSMAMLRPLLRSPGAPASERVLPQAPQQPAPGPESSSQTSPLSHEPSRASSARVPDAPIALPTGMDLRMDFELEP